MLILVNVLIVLLFYITSINSLVQNISRKHQENIHINNLIKKKKLSKSKLALNKTTPNKSNISINTILTTLEMSANKTQTIIQKIATYSYKSNYLWDSYQIELTAAGQYQYIINFINVLAQSYSLITLDKFELQKIHNSILEDEFTLSTTITIYDSKININNFAKKNHRFISQLKNYPNIKHNLSSWSLQELQFVGSLKQHNKITGFVVDPMGATHQVTIGDKIGLKQAVVLNINENGITTNIQIIN